MIEGFGVNTFRLVNAEGQARFVKFHWRPKLGAQSVLWDEAVKINGADPDFHRRELWEAIEAGETPNLRPTEPEPQQALPFDASANDAPLCSECGSIMTRNGSCYKCGNCGGTSGCS